MLLLLVSNLSFMATTLVPVGMNYNPDNPRMFKTICLKCNSTRFLDVPIMCCTECFFLSSFYIYFISGPAVIGYLAVAMSLPTSTY